MFSIKFLAVALSIIGAVVCGLGWLLSSRRYSAYREQVASQLATGELARAELENAKTQLDELNQQLLDARGSEAALKATITAKSEEHEAQLKLLDDAKKMLKLEFEQAGQALLKQGETNLSQKNQESLDQLLKPLSEKIDGFQTRVNQVHTDLTGQNASLKTQIKQLHDVGLEMSSEANSLSQALKGDKKLVGNWGEAQLERTLELAGLRRGEHYESQKSFKVDDGDRLQSDFIVYLPQDKHIVIDSKVSLVDYERAIAASDDLERTAALKGHAQAVKNHIDQLSSKDYANLPGLQSPDFVLMFMPVEPAFIEIMRDHRDLFNHGYSKNVILVSHTTLMPILRTVANLWIVERSNQEAQAISDRAGDIFNSVCLIAERLESVGAALTQTNKRYNETVTSLVGRQGLHGKVDRFKALSTKVSRSFPDSLKALPESTDAGQLRAALDEPSAADEQPDDD